MPQERKGRGCVQSSGIGRKLGLWPNAWRAPVGRCWTQAERFALDKGIIFTISQAFSIIEFRIIYLQRKQSRLLPESHHQGGALAHPLERATRMDAQLGEGGRAEVG